MLRDVASRMSKSRDEVGLGHALISIDECIETDEVLEFRADALAVTHTDDGGRVARSLAVHEPANLAFVLVGWRRRARHGLVRQTRLQHAHDELVHGRVTRSAHQDARLGYRSTIVNHARDHAIVVTLESAKMEGVQESDDGLTLSCSGYETTTTQKEKCERRFVVVSCMSLPVCVLTDVVLAAV